jgi:hypothetical protein
MWMVIYEPIVLIAICVGVGIGFVAFRKINEDRASVPSKSGCPECGSSGRHKKTCSKFQKDRGAKKK